MIEYVREQDIQGLYHDSLAYMAPLFKPFKEFERIARSQPHPGIAKHLPKVTDGTLAQLMYEQPKRYIQQIPTGKVSSDDEWLNILGTYIYEHEILPNEDKEVAELIQKCWALGTKALWYGSQPVLVKMIQRNGKIYPTFDLPYIKDVFLEPGKKSGKDCNVRCVRAWYQPRDIQYIIDCKKDLHKKYKDQFNEELEEEWDLAALAELKTKVSAKKDDEMSPNERDRGTEAKGIPLVHVFQNGIDAPMYTYSPDIDKVVRRKKNKDPRGLMPIHDMYANLDFSNPLGRGSVEQSGGKQNLLDSEMQAYQYTRLLGMDPPKKIMGTGVVMSSLSMKPGAKWRMGSAGGDVIPVELSTRAVESFANNYGLIKSQILAENSAADTTISADSGNPVFGKTPQALKMQDMNLGVSDNYMRKQFEAVYGEIVETELNLYFAERHGVEELKLDKATAEKLAKVAPGAVNQDRAVRINYDAETKKLDFRVDPSTSQLKDDAAERDRLVELLDLAGKYEVIGQMLGEQGMKELVNRIVTKSGVEDPEKIMPSMEDGEVDEQGNPINQQQQNQGIQPDQIQQMIDEALKAHDAAKPPKSPTESLNYKDAPEDIKRQIEMQAGLQPSQLTSPDQQNIDLKKFDTAAKHAHAADQQDLAYHQADTSTAHQDRQQSHTEEQAREQLKLQKAKPAETGAKR
jgi:hypothetical protein